VRSCSVIGTAVVVVVVVVAVVVVVVFSAAARGEEGGDDDEDDDAGDGVLFAALHKSATMPWSRTSTMWCEASSP